MYFSMIQYKVSILHLMYFSLIHFKVSILHLKYFSIIHYKVVPEVLDGDGEGGVQVQDSTGCTGTRGGCAGKYKTSNTVLHIFSFLSNASLNFPLLFFSSHISLLIHASLPALRPPSILKKNLFDLFIIIFFQ